MSNMRIEIEDGSISMSKANLEGVYENKKREIKLRDTTSLCGMWI